MTLLQLLCALGLALGLVIFLPESMKALAGEQRKLASLLGAGYLVCAGWLLWRERGRGELGLETLISALGVGFGPALLFAWLAHVNIPHRLLCVELAWGGVLATVTVCLSSRPRTRAAVLTICAAVGFVLPLVGISRPQPIPPVWLWRLHSQLYALKVTEYRRLINPSRLRRSSATVTRPSDVSGTTCV